MPLKDILEETDIAPEKAPFVCNVHFELNFAKVLPSGDIINYRISSDDLLAKHNITNNAVFTVFGFSLDDCISKTKKIINQLNYEQEVCNKNVG